MKYDIYNDAMIGVSHHTFYPCKDDPDHHLATLFPVLQKKDIDVVDLTIPYGENYRSKAVEMIRASGKYIVYNGYLMPTAKLPLGTLSYTERNQILMLAKDQADVALSAGCRYFMQSTGADPGPLDREAAYNGLALYIIELSKYISSKGSMPFLIEIMDRATHRRSLCGPTDEVVPFLDKLRGSVPDIGVVIDLTHIPLMNESYRKVIMGFKDYIRHVHIGGCILKDKGHKWWGDMHPPIGIPGGEVDIPQLALMLELLCEAGYMKKGTKATMSLEVRAFPGMTPDETISDNISRLQKAWNMVNGG